MDILKRWDHEKTTNAKKRFSHGCRSDIPRARCASAHMGALGPKHR